MAGQAEDLAWDGGVARDPDARFMPDAAAPTGDAPGDTPSDRPPTETPEDSAMDAATPDGPEEGWDARLPPDPGPDASQVDAGAPDAGPFDVGTPDAAVKDAGPPDAGQPSCEQLGTCDAGPPGTCDPLKLVEVVPQERAATLLLIYDRSGSLSEMWGATTFWQAAGTATVAAFSTVSDQLDVGAILFPTQDPNAALGCTNPSDPLCQIPGFPLNCVVGPITAPDQVAIQPVRTFVSAFGGPSPYDPSLPLYAPPVLGQSPLLAALTEADAHVQAAASAGPTTVVLVSDAMPNCSWDPNAALQLLADWRTTWSVDTHVVVVQSPSTTDPAAVALADNLAAAGGTGTALVFQDPTALEVALGTIARAAAQVGPDPCVVGLSPPASDPANVRLVVGQGGQALQVPRVLGGQPAWSLSLDGSRATLTGDFCRATGSDHYAWLRWEYGCDPLPELSPPSFP